MNKIYNIHFSHIGILLLLGCLCMAIQPSDAQVRAKRDTQPGEIRSGRGGGAEFGGGSVTRKSRGSQYGHRRFGNDLTGNDNSSQGKWAVGITAGTSCNWQTRDAGYAYDMQYNGRWGAVAGLTMTYKFFDWMSLRADVQYAQKNYNMTRMSSALQHIHADYTNHYLQVPVMIDWTFGSLVKSHIYTGGYGGFWMAGNVERISVVNAQKQKTRYVFNPEDNRGDGGIAAGVGVTYDPLPYLRVGAEVMLYYSLVNTVKHQPVMNDARYNNTVTIGVMATYIL